MVFQEWNFKLIFINLFFLPQDIKSAMPKNSTNFRFYFKTEVNGEAFFEQESNDAALVPMWEEGLVYVQCRND